MRKVTPKNLDKVIKKLMENIDLEYIDKSEFCQVFNEWLDELCLGDFFGTEGQNDPRGDHRE